MQGFLASPTVTRERLDLAVMSPADSNLMFSLPHSPSHPQKAFELLSKQESVEEMLASTFSPSIFSPPEKRAYVRGKAEVSSAAMYIDSPDIFNLDEDKHGGLGLGGGQEDVSTIMDDDDDPFDLDGTPVKSESPMKISLKITKLNVKSNKQPDVRADSGKAAKRTKGQQFVTPETSASSSSFLSPVQELTRKLSMSSQDSKGKRAPRAGRSTDGDADKDTPRTSQSDEAMDYEDEEDDEEEEQDENSCESSANGFASSTGPKAAVSCNCKKSKCLKLYCDCFAILQYCDSKYCRCVTCCNNVGHEAARNNAIRTIKERNSRAFRLKINEEEQQHVSGCHCKNSRCLKKYCECFTAAALCGTNCKCLSCDNYAGSEELLKIRKMQGSSPTAASLASTAAGTGAPFGGPNQSKKRKDSPNSVAALMDNSPALRSQSQLPPNKRQAVAQPPAAPVATAGVVNTTPSSGTTSLPHLSTPLPSSSNAASSSAGGKAVATRSTGKQRQPATGSQLELHQQQLQLQQSSSATRTGTRSQPLTTQPPPHSTAKSAPTTSRPPAASSSHSAVPSSSSSQRATTATTSTAASSTSSASTSTSSVVSSPGELSVDSNGPRTRAKNKKVRFATTPVVYPFFGPDLPPTTKFIALKCLDFLSCQDLYTMSTVNSLWCSAATDEALWE